MQVVCYWCAAKNFLFTVAAIFGKDLHFALGRLLSWYIDIRDLVQNRLEGLSHRAVSGKSLFRGPEAAKQLPIKRSRSFDTCRSPCRNEKAGLATGEGLGLVQEQA